MSFTRRALLGATGLAATPGLPEPWAIGTAAAQSERVLRYGISMADIPQTTGQPDRGAGAYQFTGHTLYDPLVAWEMDVADRPGKLVPGLATSWESDPADRRKWVFRLRQGVKFHDGSAFDADAVIWNFEKVLNNQAPHFDNRQAAQVRPRLPSVASWRKVDAMTVEVTTRAVDSFFPYQMLWFLISSPAQFEKLGRSWDRFAQEPSGTGPFRLARLVPRERAELVRNAEYWNPARLPKADRIVLVVAPETTTRTNALLTGQLDIIESPAPDLLPRLQQSGARIIQNVTPHVWNYHLSLLEGSPWRDLRLRRAANLAINRDEVVALLNGLAKPAAGVVDPTSPWFGNPEFKIRTDVDAARRLVQDAGFSRSNPLRTRFIVPTGGSGQMLSMPMNEYIQAAWREVGIQVEFQVVELEVLYTAWRQGAAGELSRSGGITANNVAYLTSDPLYAFIRFFHSGQINPVGVNYGHYRDAEMDRMLNAATSSFDAAEQDAIMRRVHEKVVNEALWVFVVHDTNPKAVSRNVRGYVPAQHWFQDLTTLA
ncbi:ABC transporter substrate-binding protein [Paracraurococcus ruber]|uniref:ABC transporter substrate-binding protein n=1 Tax=Paracraurococcus ruber TaxID=77675 RepID=A0ABS1CYH3_9PROT|nr:ABC transporter substrate-binding protein [Paracraurococcus ruber]MBK1659375.1 ABC transporter substrate-binding protein [Paracraurococcus ruber]TDG28071.1 ABC transporter substrate-binding protein [Paracraurococcus ruber]